MKETILKLTAAIAELQNDRSARAVIMHAADNAVEAVAPSPSPQPVSAGSADGESAHKKRAVARAQPD